MGRSGSLPCEKMPKFEVYVSWLEHHSGYITVDADSSEVVEAKIVRSSSTIPEVKGGQDTFDYYVDESLEVLDIVRDE